MFHRCVVRAAHSRTLEAAMRGIGRQLAPIRDAYSGGLEADERTLSVHVRQVAAMRAGDGELLDAVLDEHFGMLEEAFASVIGRTREEVFGRRPAAETGLAARA
jgi:DNA-binding FadR family transcriptional regulator